MPNDDTSSEYRSDSHGRIAAIRQPASARSQHRDKGADFVLTGFHQLHGIRYYVYRGHPHDGSLSEFTVDADVRLLQKHGIALQELPLLCRRLLETQNPDYSLKAVTFTEDLMKEQADQRAALKRAAQEKKTAHRRVRPAHLGRDHR